jgi:hypothetical protein
MTSTALWPHDLWMYRMHNGANCHVIRKFDNFSKIQPSVRVSRTQSFHKIEKINMKSFVSAWDYPFPSGAVYMHPPIACIVATSSSRWSWGSCPCRKGWRRSLTQPATRMFRHWYSHPLVSIEIASSRLGQRIWSPAFILWIMEQSDAGTLLVCWQKWSRKLEERGQRSCIALWRRGLTNEWQSVLTMLLE